MIDKKLMMHAMVDALENDFIEYIISICNLSDLNREILDKATSRTSDIDLKSLLQQLDLGDFIQIININIGKTNLTKKEKDFMNKELIKIIPIRNRVMHPRPLEFTDYAILKNVFDDISNEIKKISWTNVKNLKDMIDTDSDEILNIKLSKFKKTSRIMENLPKPEFDDTTYIGREKEIAELKKYIFDEQFNIISIIGEGGVGKTATIVKILYDLLEDCNFNYDAIIWSTLKTQQLDKVGFSQIENCITNLPDLQEKIIDYIPINDGLSSEEAIINFAQNFKSVLVLDNLETINTKDIKDFIIRFSKHGKIIITSRIGLGELELRYPLNGLNEREALKYMQELLKYYGLYNILTEKEIKRIAHEELYSNPLTIKWFVRSLYNGGDISELLKNKKNIIYFCMNNVYEKLSPMAVEVLALLLIENRSLTHAEIAFFLDIDVAQEIEIRKAINEISKSNFIEDTYSLNENVNLTKMSNDYLRLNHYPNKVFVNKIIAKRKEISIIKQNMELKNEFDMFNPKSITSLNSQERIIASKYLLEALGFSAVGNWKEAFSNVELAKKITPDFFECYKISAFLYAIKKDNLACHEYEMALQMCENDVEKSIVYVLLGNYWLEQDDRSSSIKYFDDALTLNPHTYVYLCKSKALTYMGKYDEALETLEKINSDTLSTLKYKNMYLTRQADIYFRKAQLDGKKNPKNTFSLIKTGIDILETSQKGDYKLYNLYANALFTLSLFYYDVEIIDYVIEKIKTKYNNLRTAPKFKTLCNLLRSRYELIKNKNKNELLIYIFDYKEFIERLEDGNIGLIIYMKDGYGFIANKKYPSNIYFNYIQGDKLEIGDIVVYDIYNDGRIIATNIAKKRKISDLLDESMM